MDTTIEKLNEPLVSILMLTYNRAHYLERTVASVLDQSYQNWKLFIIDDGSTDNTEETVASFKDPRITYIRHDQNAGLHVRRNESLSLSKGEYIAVLDSDDYWLDKEKLSEQVSFLESHPDHVLVGTFTNLIDSDGNDLGQDEFFIDDRDIRNKILLRNQFTHSAVLMRKTAIEKTNGYQDILAEDLELFLQLGQHGKVANLPIYATNHRIHKDSENDRGIKMYSAVHEIIKKHQHGYPNFYLAYCKSILRLCVAHLRQRLQ